MYSVRHVSLLWIFCILMFFWIILSDKKEVVRRHFDEFSSTEDFEGFNNETGIKDGCYIVPNYVHFIRFEQPTFSFVDAVCVLAALQNQKPEKIFFHTDVPGFKGKYWEYLLEQKNFKESLQIEYVEIPKSIFGQDLQKGWIKFHGGDIARLKILMKHGGIFLDNDSFIVKSLDEFRRFEMTLGWSRNGNLSNQVIVAHRNARFLREWLLSYKGSYDKKSWFYNAGIRPTQEVLLKKPQLVHRMKKYFAQYWGMVDLLYMKRSEEWKHHYAIHLLSRHQYMLKKNVSRLATYPVIFNEVNIKNYPITFRDMVASVFPLEK